MGRRTFMHLQPGCVGASVLTFLRIGDWMNIELATTIGATVRHVNTICSELRRARIIHIVDWVLVAGFWRPVWRYGYAVSKARPTMNHAAACKRYYARRMKLRRIKRIPNSVFQLAKGL